MALFDTDGDVKLKAKKNLPKLTTYKEDGCWWELFTGSGRS
jgi:hypothetical protein